MSRKLPEKLPERLPGKLPEQIVVEGPIGVGKSALARRLAESLNSELMLEMAHENPFLPRFYAAPKAAALPTQLYFLFRRAQLAERLRQTDLFKQAHVADFLLQKDRLFAGLTLDEDELRLYDQVYERLTLEAPAPDLVIYLQAPVEVLLRRLFARGIDYEKGIDEGYLEQVSAAYIEFFYHYDAAPLLIVNTAGLDLADDSQDYGLLLERIRALSPGRHYFNPQKL